MPSLESRLLLVTDRQQTKGRPLLSVLAQALKAGSPAIQLRERDLCAKELLALADEIRRLAGPRGSQLVINDRLDVALSVEGAGVHLRGDSLSLAVARGSGPAVAQLGGVARQSGTPVSLHGTGGAWMVADRTADTARFAEAVYHSLDRKVCNTLNVCCIVRERAADLVPLFLDAIARAGRRRGGDVKLHVVEGCEAALPAEWREARSRVQRADGEHDEPTVETLPLEGLAREWEWEDTPELSLVLADSAEEAAALFNRFSPQFAVSLVAEDELAQKRFFEAVNAPFVGDGFTRWVDGQYALNRPELGLSNWQNGRLLARGGVLAGDSVFTIRARVRQSDLSLDRQSPPSSQHVVRGTGPAHS